MQHPPCSIDRIAELLVHIGRASRADTGQADLTGAQWACLRFFARANPSTRTPSAFAGFQATTRGTASQIIKSLEKRGLLARFKSATDGRSVRFDLTKQGDAVLCNDPLGDLNGLLARLERSEREAFLATLSRLSTSLAELKNIPAFGTCADCSHFTPSGDHGFCGCMAAALGAGDINKLCASFRGQHSQGQTHDTD
ncbi:MarR family winged helix-turn-helix transcriptional regulator [Oceaniglobus ichthyenteri]|uniref:MarR family winged helix-turn-helix transcriptional regulator n=1 Tax=Oceaniglobus ichthyenteri TaxID=2136177 RepID=UPI000D38B696|nr:MarR family transcriptional regulator [Oceaniglobus ichthyenteri]